jgi:cytochrome c oxidase subunit 4
VSETTESPDRVPHSSPLRYAIVFVALVVLAAASFWISRLDLGTWDVVAVVGIAFIKAALVALFFMHLWDHRGASRLAMAVALCFIAILMTLTVLDVHLRLPITNGPTSVQAKAFMGERPLPEDSEPCLGPDRQPALKR